MENFLKIKKGKILIFLLLFFNQLLINGYALSYTKIDLGISGKNKFKPTGIEEDSFTKKQRKLAIMNRYNKELVKKKAKKSRKKYMKRQMG